MIARPAEARPIRTGFRPEQREGGRWGLAHAKAPWRDAAAHLTFDSREDAEAWIAVHVARLERVARQRRPREEG